MNEKELLEYWQVFKKDRIPPQPEYKYGEGEEAVKKKKQILDALVFWKFVQKGFQNYALKPTVRSFLQNFINDNNPHINIVAMIDMLPTRVWRKILWKHNIDFTSNESFLRRLELDQLKAIRENWADLFVHKKVPRIFGFFERIFKRITVEKLLDELIDAESRYKSKGSWSYNLFKLDMGFNKYPMGIKDDTKVVHVSPLQFFSKKNHADDFIVQRECGGIYWWWYRTVPTFWGLIKREVKLKPSICPMFWYTLIMNSWFLIFSPVFSIYFLNALSNNAHWVKLALLGIPAFLMPLWIVAAMIKAAYLGFVVMTYLIGTAIIKFLFPEPVRNKIKAWGDKHSKIIDSVLAWVGVCTCIFGITVGEIKLFGDFFEMGIGAIPTLIIFLSANIYAFGRIIERFANDEWEDFDELEFPVQLAGIAVMTTVIFLFMFNYDVVASSMLAAGKFIVWLIITLFSELYWLLKGITMFIAHWIWIAIMAAFNWIVMFGSVLAMLALPLFLLWGIVYLPTLMSDDMLKRIDWVFEKMSGAIEKAILVLTSAFFGLAIYFTLAIFISAMRVEAYTIYGSRLVGGLESSLIFYIPFAFIAWIFAVTFFFVNKESYRVDPKALGCIRAIDASYLQWYKQGIHHLRSNRSFNKLEHQEKVKLLNESERIISWIFNFKDSNRPYAYSILLPVVDWKQLKKLEECQAKIIQTVDLNLRHVFLKHFLDGKTFKKALKDARKEKGVMTFEEKAHEAKVEKRIDLAWKMARPITFTVEVIRDILAFIFKYIWKFLKAVWFVLVEIPATIVVMVNALNKVCPTVMEEKTLSID